jgi:hypothetical protein
MRTLLATQENEMLEKEARRLRQQLASILAYTKSNVVKSPGAGQCN